MTTVLERACAKLGVSSEQVLSHRETDDEIVLVVDKGIAGCPKFAILLSDLEPQAVETKEEKDDDASTSSTRSSNRRRRSKSS